jgi:hypothetical protein
MYQYGLNIFNLNTFNQPNMFHGYATLKQNILFASWVTDILEVYKYLTYGPIAPAFFYSKICNSGYINHVVITTEQ